MQTDIPSLLFYVFATLMMAAGFAVISARNPVHAVFFLIVAFFNAAGLFVLLGAEYLAMTLVIVYVGAVAVLFLFVVMMLNINFERLRAGFIKSLPAGIAMAVLLLAELGGLLYSSLQKPAPLAAATLPIPNAAEVTNAKAIGMVLYTHYMSVFEISGVILLVAMIGAIVLTHRQRLGVRKQVIASQLQRRRADGVQLMQVKSGEGV